MHLERLNNKNEILYQEAISIYENSFPREERRDEEEQRRILQKEDYHFDFLMEDEHTLIGIMLYWETEDFVFLEHFATNPNLRNSGYGSRALELLKQKGKTIILEIEPPIDELTKRRKAFYERNGLRLNPHYHIQPKYHLGDEDLELKIMSTPEVLTTEEYEKFYEYALREVAIQG